jgi:hypothetical protein
MISEFCSEFTWRDFGHKNARMLKIGTCIWEDTIYQPVHRPAQTVGLKLHSFSTVYVRTHAGGLPDLDRPKITGSFRSRMAAREKEGGETKM